MKRFPCVLFLIAACATTDAARIQRDIRERYDVLERAFAAQDVPTILSTRHPDLEVLGPNGQHDNYASMAEYTRQWFITNKPPIEVHFTMQSVDIRNPNEVAVTVVQRASRYQERNAQLHKVEHEVTQRETWVRTKEGWKMRKVDNIDLAHRKRWIDGKLEGAT